MTVLKQRSYGGLKSSSDSPQTMWWELRRASINFHEPDLGTHPAVPTAHITDRSLPVFTAHTI